MADKAQPFLSVQAANKRQETFLDEFEKSKNLCFFRK